MGVSLVVSASARARLEAARAWLAERSRAEPLRVVAANAEAGAELLRSVVAGTGSGAPDASGAPGDERGLFGWQRASLGRVAAELAGPALAARGLVPVGPLAAEAVAARVVAAAGEDLGRLAGVAEAPGLPRAVAESVGELRLAGVGPEALASQDPDLARLLARTEAELERAALADRARVFALAAEVVRAAADSDSEVAPPQRLDVPLLLLDVPLLLLDLPVWTAAEAALVAALVARAPEVLATLPAGDAASAAHLRAAGLVAEKGLAPSSAACSVGLERLQAHLFEASAEADPSEVADLGRDFRILSAPGESRECVEIARQLLAHAKEGIPFDRMAVLLRSPEEYRAHLEEAFHRAGIPAHFARGAVRPDPAGRAFVALLACAGEGLSARRFAEYLSLGELPDPTAEGAPPPAAPAGERWVAPDAELVPELVAEALAEATEGDPEREEADAPGVDALRAPRRWEQLLVDAAVIGGRARWARRLDGLAESLRLERAEREAESPDDPRLPLLERDLADLQALGAYALPLLAVLDALPEEASWGGWLDALAALASRALRRPDRVLSVLAELAPMADVGPVSLQEVRSVLSRRLLEVTRPPETSRHGRVFVAPAASARGLAFDVVCVPGLAEKLFPREIREAPLLLDRVRRELHAAHGASLPTNEDRVERERLALRLAVGAAARHLVLSYPRLDPEKARPRVPSFYGLEVLRAGEGRLPGFADLAARAEQAAPTRVGWPAPAEPDDAIDEAEHDLALLDGLLRRAPSESVGTARYLLEANPHLGRALRFRARRWLAAWTPADGLVKPSDAARAALANHQLAARSYSPTALEHFAACPYRFLLQAVHRLSPREVPEAIDSLDPLQRGSLVHDAQFALFGRLRDAGLLPVTPGILDAARAELDAVLTEVAERHREDLAPAIPKVWEDGVADVRADLREWLRRTAEAVHDPPHRDDPVPWRFALAFGLPLRRGRDPHSESEAVTLDCGIQLRGSIDLVERSGEGRLRATDHKTGKVRLEPGGVLGGGRVLQPVLYALALEKLFPEHPVSAGRLSYCTSAGGFEVRDVPLDTAARRSAEALARAVSGALEAAFLPALPAEGACRFCDYRLVCGPYEELRTRRKPQPPRGGERAPAPLTDLQALRELP